MCLNIYAELEGKNPLVPHLDRIISSRSGLLGSVSEGIGSRILHFSEDGGCACSMLADDADWNAKCWFLRSDILPSLAEAVQALADYSTNGFTFQVIWIDDHSIGERVVTTDEIVSDIRQNRLFNKVAYRVTSGEMNNRLGFGK